MESKIYLDNNATTLMSPTTIVVMNQWLNQGNPSSGYFSAKKSRALLTAFRNYIALTCGFINAETLDQNVNNSAKGMPKNVFRIIFTSCASESNVMIINMMLAAWKCVRGGVPHIISSSYEHKSILLLLQTLSDCGEIELTLIDPNKNLQIAPGAVASAIRKNTMLVTIMHANNELGIINDIDAIAGVAHNAGVPFHSDTVQTFGKIRVPLSVDAYSISFHKLYGPQSFGALIIREEFLRGYKLSAMITGTQNYGYRGGTENIFLAAAAFSGFKEISVNREIKNNRVEALRARIMKRLGESFVTVPYSQYAQCKRKCFIVFISGNGPEYLHNTLLLSIIRKVPPLICNIKLREALEDRNIIVGIGSACNTSSSKASHVLYAIGADKFVRAGTLRISLCDNNTQYEVDKFLDTFIRILRANLTDD